MRRMGLGNEKGRGRERHTEREGEEEKERQQVYYNDEYFFISSWQTHVLAIDELGQEIALSFCPRLKMAEAHRGEELYRLQAWPLHETVRDLRGEREREREREREKEGEGERWEKGMKENRLPW